MIKQIKGFIKKMKQRKHVIKCKCGSTVIEDLKGRISIHTHFNGEMCSKCSNLLLSVDKGKTFKELKKEHKNL